jgi:hypothetical protein
MEITLKQWISSALSCKYISNFSIIACVIAYYTNAYPLFFLLMPIIISNLILIVLLEYNDLDTLVKTIFNINPLTPQEVEQFKNLVFQFIIFYTIWHILPILWIYYTLQRDNLVYLFKPNYMNIFLQSCLLVVIYFYFSSKNKLYGDINYPGYLVIYIIVLLGTCISIFYTI